MRVRVASSDRAACWQTTDARGVCVAACAGAGAVSLADLRITSGAGNPGAILLSWGVGAATVP